MAHTQSHRDHHSARFNMVHGLLRPNQVVRPDIVDAFSTIPRENFLPKDLQKTSYVDDDLPVGEGRFQMCPLTFAKLLQASDIREDDVVLDIGCLSGYSTSVIGKIASSVIGIDCHPNLLSQATEEASNLDILNVIYHYAELRDGFPKNAPYSLIFIEGEVDYVPDVILQQLSENGRLLTIVKTNPYQSVAKLYRRIGNHFASQNLFDANAKPLPGFQKKIGFSF